MASFTGHENWYCAKCDSRNAPEASCGTCGRKPQTQRAITSPLDPKWLATLPLNAPAKPSLAELRREQQSLVDDVFGETRRQLQTGELPELF